MAGLFEEANRAVVEAAYLNVEWTKTADAISAAQTPPAPGAGSGATGSIQLRKSTRGVIVALPSAGQTMDVKVFAYLSGTDAPAKWIELTEAARTDIGEDGDSWKINTGGASEIIVSVTTLSGGTAEAWYGRSYAST